MPIFFKNPTELTEDLQTNSWLILPGSQLFFSKMHKSLNKAFNFLETLINWVASCGLWVTGQAKRKSPSAGVENES